MSSLPERLRGLVDRSFSVLRQNLELILPVLLIVLGLALSIASLSSQQTIPYAQTFSGTVAPGNLTLSLPVQQLSYVQVNLTASSCNLRVYPATETESLAFNLTGELPRTWISCDNRTTAVGGDTAALILVNPGPASVGYEIAVRAYLIQTPFDWLALPGTVIALAGLLAFVPRFVLREALRFGDEFGRNRKKK